MKFIFLVIDYMPHQLTTINTLIDNYDVDVLSFTYKKSTPSKIHPKHSFFQYDKDSPNFFLDLILNSNPVAVVVAGWHIKDFVWISKKVRKILDIPIVAYSDTQWHGNFRQRLNCLISPYHLKKAFTHIWVSGMYQYEYARRLKFSKSKIITYALSCNQDFFLENFTDVSNDKKNRNILFVGRFVDVKGLDLLLTAWSNISDKKGWKLTLIGDGPLKRKIAASEDIEIKDYMNNNDLITEMRNAGCFILTSVFETWGVVIHEAVASGLPVIATNVCGAVPHLVKNNYNGFVVNPNVFSISIAIQKLISLDSDELAQLSLNSRILATQITPDITVANLYSIV